jgi:hypothetical protein
MVEKILLKITSREISRQKYSKLVGDPKFMKTLTKFDFDNSTFLIQLRLLGLIYIENIYPDLEDPRD